ncbi:MAG: tyrosine--tRNA ligase [Firmicutes bacterium]|nr:tyrosine--tRNA ligase [Bacillota bacterium]
MDGSIAKTVDYLVRGCEDVVSPDLLARKLEQVPVRGPLTVKLGVDPTAPDLHLGHTVVMEKLRQFQDLGHRVVLLIGDMTGRVGDPTEKASTRKQLSAEEVAAFARTYVEQAGKVLDVERLTVRYNSEWLEALQFADVVELLSRMTVARVLERDDFARRFAAHVPIHLHELLYPLMQGYDSVALRADVELGGTDQRFNIMTARQIQEAYGQEPEVGMFLPILEGTDGVRRMGKSLGNYIGISEPPEEIYGKTMSIPDSLIERWGVLLLGWDAAEVRARLAAGTNPRDLKAELARALVARFWNPAAAEAAEAAFNRTFRERQVPEDAPRVPLPSDPWQGPALDLVARLPGIPSRSEARRLLQQGAVVVDGERLGDGATVTVRAGSWVRVGKRRFFRLEAGG